MKIVVGFMCLIASVVMAAQSSSEKAKKPNILIIFTDDQGYGDLGCFGSQKNRTPRMDQLALEGTRFTSFYASGVCSGSRSSLVTGRYPPRSKGWMMPASEIAFGELLKTAGYQTACIGKWDLSHREALLDRMPNAQGFDYYFGTLGANDSGSVTFYENSDPAGGTSDMGSLLSLYTDKAINYLENKRDPENPFVLYLAHTMMHTIIDASPRFKGTSEGGLYGDVVEEFDYETGRLLDTLDKLGLREDTLVIYTSDNGPWCQRNYYENKSGHPEGSIFWGDPGPFRGGKGSAYEGGSHVPCIVRWPGKVPAGKTSNSLWAIIDFLPTFASLAGIDIPMDRPIDGIDQTGLLLGTTDEGRESYVYSQAGKPWFTGAAIRKGKWKLLLPDRQRENTFLMDFGTNDFELYDLTSDMGEKINLANKYPEVVTELRGTLSRLMDEMKTGQEMHIQ